MTTKSPVNIVLVGGGHAHALLLSSWKPKLVKETQLTVISPSPTAPYTGMLPGFVAGHYTRTQLNYDLVKLVRAANGRLVQGFVTHIDRDAKQVVIDHNRSIPYDVCSVNVGATTDLPSLPGFDEHAIGAKPLGVFANRWTDFLQHVRASTEQQVFVAVLGGGVAGSELAMAINYRLRELGKHPTVTIIDHSDVLREVGQKARSEILKKLDEHGVVIRNKTVVRKLSHGLVELGNGEQLQAGLIVGATGVRALPWLARLGLSVTDGFLNVGPTLQTVNDPHIFAVGDCAHMVYAPRPKAGVFAVRQAPVLTHNIEALLNGEQLKAFEPQRDYLKLVSLGKKSAGADKFGQFAASPILWRLKDRIDQKFMNGLHRPTHSPPRSETLSSYPEHAATTMGEHH